MGTYDPALPIRSDDSNLIQRLGFGFVRPNPIARR
jgi:hypothetical protein